MARTESPMRRAVVLGGGEIGAGWAALFAAYGIEATLVDPDAQALSRAQSALRVAQALGVGRGRPGTLALARDLEPALPEAEWIQEAAPEMLELKQSLFARIESLAPSAAILASSTSSLTRAQLAQGMRRPERLGIVHPLQPGDARAAVERDLRSSLGQIPKTHAAGESAWAKTLSRVARAAEELDGPFPGDPGRRLP